MNSFMKIDSNQRALSYRKKKSILSSKIISTLASFVKEGHSINNKSNISKVIYPELNKTYIMQSFPKTPSHNRYHLKNKNNASRNNNTSYKIKQEDHIINPLFSLYNNKFYPHSYKNKNYIKEVYNCLPPLVLIKNYDYNNNCQNKKIDEILSSEYQNNLSNFNNIYKNNGEDLFNEIANSKDLDNDSYIDIIKQNELNIDESNFITSVLKDKKKNYTVKLKNEKFKDPENSLLTLKINSQLYNKVKESASNYQYNSYADKINENQKNKLKLLIMPKTNIKVMKYAFEINKNKRQFDKNNTEGDEKSKKLLTINKHLFKKINKKIENEANNNQNDKEINKELKESKNQNQNENNKNPDEKLTISSTIIRNILILEVKSYYCKCLTHGTFNPCSRMGATFTPYYNQLFLFGGLTTTEQSDLWILELKNNVYTWKKIKYSKDINFNPRYGHSCVLFNNSLYIFGGNLNLKKLKYPLEDILIYNIKSNTMKIGVFKNDKLIYSSRNFYIPQRRNHIAEIIGWNMIVHGGVDISKEYLKESNSEINEEEIRNVYNGIKNMDIHGNVLGDFMSLDLITLKWMNLSNIVYKIKGKKFLRAIKNGIPRVYHSSCLVLSYENILKGSKLNIYKKNTNIKTESLEIEEIDDRQKFDVKYEGIYIFGGLDEYLKETNNLFILHCFRNPLVFFEPALKGQPPSPRCMAAMNYNKTLNFITIYGGKDSLHVFNDLYILDIMNFQWFKIDLFGPDSISGRMGHCAGIINEKLYIFGGCDEDNKYPSAKVLCVELDLLRNKKLSKIYDFAKSTLDQNAKDKTAKNVMQLLKDGAEIPHDVYPFLHLDE